MLHLMVSDPWRAVYVGRPCYFEMRSSAPCTSAYWTNRRFSAEVVASMATVIQTELSSSGARSVRLFGHSGGGTLAVLLSRDLATISGIVTVAGNLDTDAWARLHHYTPLRGSLNPADVQLSPSVAAHSVHWAGGRDHVVPSGLIRNAAGRIGGRVEEVRAYSHQCCWEDIWPSVLAAISGEN
jgi:pimeloyl-ACP methyl ester carboxylesterase